MNLRAVRFLPLYFVIAVFLIVRIGLSVTMPIFNDEAIFLHWGHDIVSGSRPWWFPVVHDGKPPMTAVAFGLSGLLPIDPLLSARLVSLVFAVGTVLVSCLTVSIVFPSVSRVLYGVLFAVNPLLVLFGTLALSESAAMFFFVLVTYVSVRFHRRPTALTAAAAGLAVGIGYWWKATALAGAGVFLVHACSVWLGEPRRRCGIAAYTVIGVVVAALTAVPLLAPPYGEAIAAGQAKWMLGVTDLVRFPVDIWFRNLVAAVGWALGYGPIPVVIATLAGLWMTRDRASILYAASAVIPVIAGIVLGRQFTTRYVVLAIPSFLAFAAWGLTRFSREVPKAGAFVASTVVVCSLAASVVLAWFPVSYLRLLTAFAPAARDFSQYVTGWTSGWGVREAVDEVRKRKDGAPGIILVREDSGNPEDAVFVYALARWGIGVGYVNHKTDYRELRTAIPHIPVRNWYFVSRGGQYAGLRDDMVELVRFAKPAVGDDEFVGLYRFIR